MRPEDLLPLLREIVREEVGAAVGSEVRRLACEVEALRRSLPPQLVTVEEAARMTGLSISTIRRRVRAGDIPSRHIGRSVRVDLGALHPLRGDDVAQLARFARASPL